MAYNSLSGTVIGPDKIVAKEDGTFTQMTASISGTYIDMSGNAVPFSSIGTLGGAIGTAEDGIYTDGLFTDFTQNTLIGVPIDRYNELFKSLVPPPAPSISRVDVGQDGTDAYLSFGASNDMESDATPYYSVGTTAGFSAVDKGQIYQTQISGNNFRQSIFEMDTNITGFINFHVTASVLGSNTNYPADAFGNGETGTLKIFINNTVTPAHTLNLSTATGAGFPGAGTSSSLNGEGTGFTNISTTGSAIDANGNTFDIFKHRTAKYLINTASQRRGWNYAYIEHDLGGTQYTTNFIEWVNDDNADAITITNNSLTNITLSGSRFLSGVQYNTSATADYQFLITNFYKNVYNLATVTCTDSTSNASISNTTMPHIGADDETKAVAFTQSLSTTDQIILNESIGATASVTHIFKGTATGNTSMSGFLIFTPTVNSATNTAEFFKDESTYRLPSASYDSQASVTTGSWNSQTHMTGSGNHSDGLQIFNQTLVSPINTIENGNFANITNTAAGNPDYSGVVGLRTFYRAFKNTGADKQDVSITIKGSATIVSSVASLGANGNVRVFVKTPGKTDWMNLADNFVFNDVSEGAGANELGLDATIDASGAVNIATLGTKAVATGEYFLVRIEADADWTGNISEISVVFGAGSGSITNPADVSRVDETMLVNGSSAKLSFGSGSNDIAGYSNATNIPAINSIATVNTSWLANTTTTNQRLGVYLKNYDITGKINNTINSSRFTDGDKGELQLFVNGTKIHSASLSTFGSGNSLNISGSGFTSLSTIDYPTYTNGVHDYTKPFRTGSIIIDTNEQRNGWNYVQVKHSGTFGERETSYIEWINDGDSNGVSISVTGGVLSNFHNDGTYYYSSGIKHFATAPSASFTLTASNCYYNVYSYSAIAVDVNDSLSNTSIINITGSGDGLVTRTDLDGEMLLPTLQTGIQGVNTASLNLTTHLSFNQAVSLHGAFETSHTSSIASVKIYEPPAQGSTSFTIFTTSNFSVYQKSKFLRFSGSETNTNINSQEHFTGEGYRLQNRNVTYSTQTDITNLSNAWDWELPVNDTSIYDNYADGLVVFGGKLISPTKAGDNGDCRNISDGGILQAPTGNVDYSSGNLDIGMRTYVRYFQNNSGASKPSATITLYGSGTLEDVSDALGSGKFTVEVKFPSTSSQVSTAWLDAGSPYTSNNKDVDGAGAFVGAGDSLPLTISTGGTSFSATFNGGSWLTNQYLLVRVRASASWDGYIDRIDIG